MRRLVELLIVSVALAIPATRASPDDAVPPVVFPSVPAEAGSASDLVPNGWAAEKQERGDLNGDGVPDLALVLRMDDPENVIEGRSEPLDTNPRLLVVAFADPETNALSVALADHTLIPRHVNPAMEDPLGDVEIARGTLRVSLGTWMSMGGWSTSNVAFTFRHQDGCFRLIGYDAREIQRNTMRSSEVSINYLTKKVLRSWGYDEDVMNETWATVESADLRCLEDVGDGLDFTPALPRGPDRAAALLKATAASEPRWSTELESLRIGSGDASVTFADVRSTCSEAQLTRILGPTAEPLRECFDPAMAVTVRVAFAGGRIATGLEPDDEGTHCVAMALDRAHFDDLECTFEARLSAE